MGHVRDEVGEFDDVVEARPGRGQTAPEVLEDLVGLRRRVALADQPAPLVERELSGDGHETAGAHDDMAVLGGGSDPVGGGNPRQLAHGSIVDHGSDSARSDGRSVPQPRKPSRRCSVEPRADIDAVFDVSGSGSGRASHVASRVPMPRGTVPSDR